MFDGLLLLWECFSSVDSRKLSFCWVNNDTTGALGFILCCVIFDPSYILCYLALNDDTTRFSLDICFDVANCVLFYTEAWSILLPNIKNMSLPCLLFGFWFVCYLALYCMLKLCQYSWFLVVGGHVFDYLWEVK